MLLLLLGTETEHDYLALLATVIEDRDLETASNANSRSWLHVGGAQGRSKSEPWLP
jgi:hypothetical protein